MLKGLLKAETHSHGPDLTSSLGSQHQHPDGSVKEPGLGGPHPSHTHGRVGTPNTQSSVQPTIFHLVQKDNADYLMGIFEQMCMSQNGRQGSPQEDRAPQSSMMKALKSRHQPGQEAS